MTYHYPDTRISKVIKNWQYENAEQHGLSNRAGGKAKSYNHFEKDYSSFV